MSNILITIPTRGMIHPGTIEAVYNMELGDNCCRFKVVDGYDIATARNKAAKMALDAEADYLLMIDDDVIPPEDALVNMLENPCLVKLGFYAHRNKNNLYTGITSICKMGQHNYTHQYTSDELRRMCYKGEYMVRIHGGGMGFALIDTKVFRHIKPPWFKWEQSKYVHLSEDLYFCELCNMNGAQIYTDTRVNCGHVFRYVQNV